MTGDTHKSITNWKNLEKVRRRHPISYQLPESSSLDSMLAEWWGRHQEGPWVRMIGHRQPGNESPHHKPETASPVRSHPPGVPHPAVHTQGPFSVKSPALSARVSLDNSFLVLDESPLLGAGMGPPSCNTSSCYLQFHTNLEEVSGILLPSSDMPSNFLTGMQDVRESSPLHQVGRSMNLMNRRHQTRKHPFHYMSLSGYLWFYVPYYAWECMTCVFTCNKFSCCKHSF